MITSLATFMFITFAWVSTDVNCQAQIKLDSQHVLKLHNDVRKEAAAGKLKGQPKGKIPPLKWSDKLAAKAYDWATRCSKEGAHRPDRSFNGGTMGENMAAGWSSTGASDPEANSEQAVEMWKDEYKQYKFGSGFGKDTGHYTQLVWAKTKEVGCGMAQCDKGYTMICNYFPGGNMKGEKPYETL